MPAAATALSVAVFLLASHPAPVMAQHMAMPGNFDVSGTGAAAYSIPISVPPGTAGMTPALALAFSSQGSNGIVGMGWSLSGLPSISRCPRTFTQDGVSGSVNFDSNDRFCLDGQRLMAINNAAYGADGTEYRTEIESFSRVISHGAAGTGPAWFEVHTKPGQIMEFGHTADSLVLAQGKLTARNWAVNKVSDTKGNYFTVTYTNDTTNGQAYPIEIDYTGNAGAGLVPYNKVQFIYATRPDITPTYQAGSLLQTTVRLTNVQTYAGVNLVADYRLAYDATITSLSSLTSVTLCAADGSCLPPTSFTATSNSGITFNGGTFTYPGASNYGSPPDRNWTSIVGDINGDGKTDFAFAGANGVNVYLSNGNGTFSSTSFPYPSGATYGSPPALFWRPIVGDFNGDGKTDFAFANGNGFNGVNGVSGVNVYLSKGDGTFSWVFSPYPNGGNYGSSTSDPIIGDFNGDGRTDFAFAGETEVDVYLSNGDGTFSSTSFPYPNGLTYSAPPSGLFWSPPIVGDFNGDGKTDFAYAGGTGGLNVYLSNGDGTFSAIQNPGNGYVNPCSGNPVAYCNTLIVGDFNGDGKTDFAIAGFGSLPAGWVTLTFWISKGDGTFSASPSGFPIGWNFTGGTFPPEPINWNWSLNVADFNGDGKTDFALVGGTTAYVFLSSGYNNGTFSYSSSAYTFPNGWNFGHPPEANYTPVVGDFNGDGKTDFAFAGATSIYTFQSGGPLTYQLNAVTNGLGATTAFTYQPITNGSVYTKDTTSTYPIVDVQVPIYVVSRVDTSNGIGGTNGATYTYAGAKVDLSGRGFLGFRQVRSTDLQTNIVSTTNIRQDYPYIGLTASQSKMLNGATLNATNNAYGNTWLGNSRFQVSLMESQASSTDLDGSVLPTVTTSYQYDAFGNATQVAVSATDGHSKTTTNTYTNDTVNWLLGRLTNASVTSQLSQPGSPPALLPTPPPPFIVINNHTNNLNLWNYLVANNLATAGTPVTVNVLIQPTVEIGSTSPGVPAFDTGVFPSGSTVQITNNGTIVGAGGTGGAGGCANGGPGGPAVRTQIPLVLANNGRIWGGGGGGGGGAPFIGSASDGNFLQLSGGGGGNGAGFGGSALAGGTGGAGDTYTDTNNNTYSGDAGANGGGPGLAGMGIDCAGGTSGAAVVGNSFITWTTTGDRRGPLN
jgi:hypothetical protein